jgi:hypothetical protein
MTIKKVENHLVRSQYCCCDCSFPLSFFFVGGSAKSKITPFSPMAHNPKSIPSFSDDSYNNMNSSGNNPNQLRVSTVSHESALDRAKNIMDRYKGGGGAGAAGGGGGVRTPKSNFKGGRAKHFDEDDISLDDEEEEGEDDDDEDEEDFRHQVGKIAGRSVNPDFEVSESRNSDSASADDFGNLTAGKKVTLTTTTVPAKGKISYPTKTYTNEEEDYVKLSKKPTSGPAYSVTIVSCLFFLFSCVLIFRIVFLLYPSCV